jgi:hypothetical protein
LNVKKAIEIVNKFEMIPPSGSAVAKTVTGGGPTKLLGGYNSTGPGGAGMMRSGSADGRVNMMTMN